VTVQRSLSTVFKSLQKALDYPIPLLSSGAFNPASISGLRSRLLDANTFTSPIDSKYYLADSSTTNTHLPRQGRCWLFDGSNDCGAAPTTLSIAGSNTCTITAMVKMTIQPGSLAAIFAETTASPGFTRFGVFADTSNKIVIVSRDTVTTDTGSSITSTGVATLATGTWYHVAVTYDAATDTRSIYINGVLDFTTSATPIATFTAGAPAVVSVGCYGSGASNFLPGAVRDVRVYNTAKTAGEITAIYNQSRTGSGTFDSTGLLAAYPCNEESGTTGYDISGNGRHLTLTNITEATFHATDTGVLANRNNAEGYRLSGSVYIPKRLSDSLAADGNALTVSGRAAYHGCAEPPCVTGDGSSVRVELASQFIPLSADFELSVCAYFDTVYGSFEVLVGQVENVGAWLSAFGICYTGGAWIAFFGSYTANKITFVPNGNAWNAIRIRKVGTTLFCSINGGVESSTTCAATITAEQNTRLLMSAGGSHSNARIADFRITTGGVTTYIPLQDGPGSSNTNRDIAWVKSDGTGGIISSAIVNGTVSTIWGNRVPGNVEDWCVKYGGRIATNGAFVAGMLAGGNAADGSAKTLAAGKFGNPFSRLNLNPATAAELNGRSVPTAAAAGADINATITPTDSAFRRTASDGDDRILIYDATLSGADLSNVEGYVA